jgi:hypothetical protein
MVSVGKLDARGKEKTERRTRKRSPVIDLQGTFRTTSLTTKGMAYFKLRHERFDLMKELPGSRMGNLLQVKPPFEDGK